MGEMQIASAIAARSEKTQATASQDWKGYAEHVVAYVPTGVIAGYTALWTVALGSETADAPIASETKFAMAVVAGLVAGLGVFAAAHGKERKKAKEEATKKDPQATPPAVPIRTTFKKGLFGVGAAAVAAFVWATAVPSSWWVLPLPYSAFMTTALLIAVSLVLGALAMLWGPLPDES